MSITIGQFLTDTGQSQMRESVAIAIQISTELGTKYPDKPRYFKHAIGRYQALVKVDTKEQRWQSACEHSVQALEIIIKHLRNSHDNADILSAYVTTLELYLLALEKIYIRKTIEVYDVYAEATAEFERLEAKYQYYQMRRAGAFVSQAKLHFRLGDLTTSKAKLAQASTTLEGYVPAMESMPMN